MVPFSTTQFCFSFTSSFLCTGSLLHSPYFFLSVFSTRLPFIEQSTGGATLSDEAGLAGTAAGLTGAGTAGLHAWARASPARARPRVASPVRARLASTVRSSPGDSTAWSASRRDQPPQRGRDLLPGDSPPRVSLLWPLLRRRPTPHAPPATSPTAARFPWPSSSMPTRKMMTCGSRNGLNKFGRPV